MDDILNEGSEIENDFEDSHLIDDDLISSDESELDGLDMDDDYPDSLDED